MLGFDISVALPGLEGRSVVVRVPGLFATPRLVVEGRPAPRGPRKNTYLLRAADGTTKTVVLEPGLLVPVRRLECDGVTLPAPRSLGWRERLWFGLPVVVLYLGAGIPGALLGAVAARVNGRMLRRPESSQRRYALAGLVVLATAAIAGLLRVAAAGVLGLTLGLLLFGRWSCSELTFDATRKAGPGTTRVDVTAEDERAHRALAWVATEVTGGKATGGRTGRRIVDDFWTFVRERHVDPFAVRTPVFVIRGTAVFITPISHCL